VTLRDVRSQLEHFAAGARDQAEPLVAGAREQWQAAVENDLRLRIGSAFAGGLILGRVVRRLGR
jgi:hypothetical protein